MRVVAAVCVLCACVWGGRGWVGGWRDVGEWGDVGGGRDLVDSDGLEPARVLDAQGFLRRGGGGRGVGGERR